MYRRILLATAFMALIGCGKVEHTPLPGDRFQILQKVDFLGHPATIVLDVETDKCFLWVKTTRLQWKFRNAWGGITQIDCP